MKLIKPVFIATVALALAACATVRQQDLDAWSGVSVEALDTHPIFMSMPQYRSTTPDGYEVRNYANGKEVEQCFASGSTDRSGKKTVSHSQFVTCSDTRIVCNNVFYIKGGVVQQYAPSGSCYTDASVRPQGRYQKR